MTNP